jgi:hypothetical protein
LRNPPFLIIRVSPPSAFVGSPLKRAFGFVALAVGSAVAFGACDGSAPVLDASAPVASRAAQIALRIDVQPTAPASLSGLAYRAAYSGISQREVLGLVDPMAGGGAAGLGDSAAAATATTTGTGTRAAAAVDAAHGCIIRDLDRASTDLASHGDSIELEELKGIAVSGLDAARPELLRLSPRLFPDIAASIGGVVSEGGPVGLSELPAGIRVTEAASATAGVSEAEVALPTPAWTRLVNGAPSAAGLSVSTADDLALGLSVTGAGDTTVELRPLGATVALTCAVPSAAPAAEGAGSTAPAAAGASTGETAFVVSRQLLLRLVAAAGGAPGAPIAAALDVVRRSELALAPSNTGVSIEIRTSTLVELRP